MAHLVGQAVLQFGMQGVQQKSRPRTIARVVFPLQFAPRRVDETQDVRMEGQALEFIDGPAIARTHGRVDLRQTLQHRVRIGIGRRLDLRVHPRYGIDLASPGAAARDLGEVGSRAASAEGIQDGLFRCAEALQDVPREGQGKHGVEGPSRAQRALSYAKRAKATPGPAAASTFMRARTDGPARARRS